MQNVSKVEEHLERTGMSEEPIGDAEAASRLADLIRHMRHPVKHGLLTLGGDEDCDIPELTASFLMGGAQIEDSELPHSH